MRCSRSPRRNARRETILCYVVCQRFREYKVSIVWFVCAVLLTGAWFAENMYREPYYSSETSLDQPFVSQTSLNQFNPQDVG